MGLNLVICKRVLNEILSKPIQRYSTNRSLPCTKSFKAFSQLYIWQLVKNGFLNDLVHKRCTLANVQRSIAIKYCKFIIL